MYLYRKKIICSIVLLLAAAAAYCQTAEIDDYTRNIQINPYSAESYYGRGNAKSKVHDTSGAIADYTRAIQLDPALKKA